jgi:hypothetical protein
MAVIEAIETTYLEKDVTSVTFSSLGSYEHLQLRYSLRSTRSTQAYDNIYVRFNDDSGTNYSGHYMLGYATTGAAGGTTSQSNTWGYRASAGTAVTAQYGVGMFDIYDYRSTNKNTTFMGVGGTNGSYNETGMFEGLWDSTAAVTSILLYPTASTDWVRGSEFTLYGIKSS